MTSSSVINGQWTTAIVAETVTIDRSGVPATMRSQNRVAATALAQATAQATAQVTADGFKRIDFQVHYSVFWLVACSKACWVFWS